MKIEINKCLDIEYIKENAYYFNLANGVLDELVKQAKNIKNDNKLFDMLSKKVEEIEHTNDYGEINWDNMPTLMPALCLIGMLPLIKDFYNKNDIPETILVDTLSDLGVWIQEYYKNNNKWGLDQFSWLSNSFTGKIFKIGRLQYEISDISLPAHIWKNKNTDDVVVFSEKDYLYDEYGYITTDDNKKCFVSAYNIFDKTISGYPIIKGKALKTIKNISKDDHIEVYTPSSKAINLHIQAGNPLLQEECVKSIKQANKFFRDYFPQIDYSAYICESWLLGPCLYEILPESSNIYKFLELFNLIPDPHSSNGFWGRIFNRDYSEDIDNAPCKNSLQKGMIKLIKDGTPVLNGGGVILSEK